MTYLSKALIACSPFVLLKLFYLADTNSLQYLLFGFGLIVPAGFVVAVLWFFYTLAEVAWRNKESVCCKVPCFGFAGALLVGGFFLPALLLRPTLETIPWFCRATQVTTWSTSEGDFILVAIGTGTIAHHQFDGGYLNWTGDGRSGFTSFHLKPIEFQYDYYQPHVHGSVELLRRRMANAGLEESDVNSISSDVWSVLQQAAAGTEISPAIGIVSNVESYVADEWDAKIGGMVWLFVLLVVFWLVSRLTTYSAKTI